MQLLGKLKSFQTQLRGVVAYLICPPCPWNRNRKGLYLERNVAKTQTCVLGKSKSLLLVVFYTEYPDPLTIQMSLNHSNTILVTQVFCCSQKAVL